MIVESKKNALWLKKRCESDVETINIIYVSFLLYIFHKFLFSLISKMKTHDSYKSFIILFS